MDSTALISIAIDSYQLGYNLISFTNRENITTDHCTVDLRARGQNKPHLAPSLSTWHHYTLSHYTVR